MFFNIHIGSKLIMNKNRQLIRYAFVKSTSQWCNNQFLCFFYVAKIWNECVRASYERTYRVLLSYTRMTDFFIMLQSIVAFLITTAKKYSFIKHLLACFINQRNIDINVVREYPLIACSTNYKHSSSQAPPGKCFTF